MKAVVVRAHGGLEQLRFEETPTPEPRPQQVLVAVKACALNYLDIWVRKGAPGLVIDFPRIPGAEIAGDVAAVGPGVEGIPVGTACVVHPGLGCGRCSRCIAGDENLCDSYGIIGASADGGYAEYACVPAANVVPKPETLSYEEVAATPLVFLTAWHMLVARAALKPGEDVLVTAAGSGVGTAAIQVARLCGARVLAAAGSDEKLEKATGLGASETINYQKASLLEEVRRLTGGRGVDVVCDSIGATAWRDCLACLKKGGRLVNCGATSGADVQVDVRDIFWRQLTILGSTMGTKAELLHLLELLGEGRLTPVIDQVFPLREAAAAQQKMVDRKQFGKILLRP